mgnify:FL=1|tara:strand:+ start:3849 stop:4748 length:900 start_codon:yes stop_codon:yes gene_type:complete
MFLNNVTSDGNYIEGLGSVLSPKLMSYGISRSLNLKYINNDFRNLYLGHSASDNMSNEEYDERLNNYLNFDYINTGTDKKDPFDIFFDYPHPNKEKVKGINKFINTKKRDIFFQTFKYFINKIYKEKYITDLKTNIDDEFKTRLFKEGVNIVIHLRAPSDADVTFAASRNFFYGSFEDSDKVNNIISQIEHSEKSRKLNFHILSTGQKKNFQYLDTLFEKNEILLHLNLNILDTFSMMVHNDLFIASQSGLSYAAHLLNEKPTLFPNDFNMGNKKVYNNSLFLDSKGLLYRLDLNNKLF